LAFNEFILYMIFKIFNENSHYRNGHFKGSSDPSYFIFEINVGKRRIRHTKTLKLKNEFLNRQKSIEDDVVEIQSRSMSDPPLSDIYFKNKMSWIWTALKKIAKIIHGVTS